MTATFPAHILRAIRNKSMAALYGIAAEFDCDLSDVLDIVVAAPFINPSQPGSTSSRSAADTPVAQPSGVKTDGEAASSLPASSSVTLYDQCATFTGSTRSNAVNHIAFMRHSGMLNEIGIAAAQAADRGEPHPYNREQP